MRGSRSEDVSPPDAQKEIPSDELGSLFFRLRPQGEGQELLELPITFAYAPPNAANDCENRYNAQASSIVHLEYAHRVDKYMKLADALQQDDTFPNVHGPPSPRDPPDPSETHRPYKRRKVGCVIQGRMDSQDLKHLRTPKKMSDQLHSVRLGAIVTKGPLRKHYADQIAIMDIKRAKLIAETQSDVAKLPLSTTEADETRYNRTQDLFEKWRLEDHALAREMVETKYFGLAAYGVYDLLRKHYGEPFSNAVCVTLSERLVVPGCYEEDLRRVFANSGIPFKRWGPVFIDLATYFGVSRDHLTPTLSPRCTSSLLQFVAPARADAITSDYNYFVPLHILLLIPYLWRNVLMSSFDTQILRTSVTRILHKLESHPIYQAAILLDSETSDPYISAYPETSTPCDSTPSTLPASVNATIQSGAVQATSRVPLTRLKHVRDLTVDYCKLFYHFDPSEHISDLPISPVQTPHLDQLIVPSLSDLAPLPFPYPILGPSVVQASLVDQFTSSLYHGFQSQFTPDIVSAPSTTISVAPFGTPSRSVLWPWYPPTDIPDGSRAPLVIPLSIHRPLLRWDNEVMRSERTVLTPDRLSHFVAFRHMVQPKPWNIRELPKPSKSQYPTPYIRMSHLPNRTHRYLYGRLSCTMAREPVVQSKHPFQLVRRRGSGWPMLTNAIHPLRPRFTALPVPPRTDALYTHLLHAEHVAFLEQVVMPEITSQADLRRLVPVMNLEASAGIIGISLSALLQAISDQVPAFAKAGYLQDGVKRQGYSEWAYVIAHFYGRVIGGKAGAHPDIHCVENMFPLSSTSVPKEKQEWAYRVVPLAYIPLVLRFFPESFDAFYRPNSAAHPNSAVNLIAESHVAGQWLALIQKENGGDSDAWTRAQALDVEADVLPQLALWTTVLRSSAYTSVQTEGEVFAINLNTNEPELLDKALVWVMWLQLVYEKTGHKYRSVDPMHNIVT